MAKGILARKVGMTQLFTDRGTVVAVTVLQSDSCHVVQVKTAAGDGYDAVQLGFGERRPKRTSKPMAGHFKRAGLKPLDHIVEVRNAGTPRPGMRVTVDVFHAGDKIDVVGVSKGKGFAGTHKRHNFKLGPGSHGSHNIYQPGSIGSVDAARTFKGLRMGGHMGAECTTVRGLEIVRVDAERELLMVKGAVPGASRGVVLVRHADRDEAY